jgi:hypothetical protein
VSPTFMEEEEDGEREDAKITYCDSAKNLVRVWR